MSISIQSFQFNAFQENTYLVWDQQNYVDFLGVKHQLTGHVNLLR